ncbi:type IV pilus assembly protein PilE [Allopseudospirillum japonicum]|uniref:Type IV pilus assembly protein PilE n=1 Tax=Allopseudospirillum japonicum TaxID=64971 RepID=A0A1H6SFX6_9GAMM|nr:type IV pilin protein [Allopseudospirillum japonicum]SEI66801.1 type IV pilus assembly protein PilE [Allopseudospirillum japonicum]
MFSARSCDLNQGFSLIELMLVILALGILAALAYPSYQQQVLKSQRQQAWTYLMRIQIAQEKWRASHPSYTQSLQDLGMSSFTEEGDYQMEIQVLEEAAWGYRLIAKAQGQQTKDTPCQLIILTYQAGVTQKTPHACWP